MAFLRNLFFRSAAPNPEKQAEREEKDRIIEEGLEQNRQERKAVRKETDRYVSTLNEAMWILGGGS